MADIGEVCLYASGEVPYVCFAGVRWEWHLPTKRQFAFEDGVCYVNTGNSWCPLTRVPDWKAAIQFSRGFEAGRVLLRIGLRGEV